MFLKSIHFISTITLPTRLRWLRKNWIQLLLCFLLFYLLVRKNVTLSISFNNDFTTTATSKNTLLAKNTSKDAKQTVPTFVQQRQLDYVKRFAKVAKSEMNKYGIPASIKLAQGLLESNAGNSPLASNTNNHFGIKCFSKNCTKGHCANFSDDSHKDFFRIFGTPWESYRAHSELLQNERYKHLKGSNYQSWAKGLVKAGYATDPEYAEKLINLIETMELYKYDS